MAGLNRRLQVFEREWIVDDDALTIAEREADFRIVLRAVRDEYQRRGGTNPDLPDILQILQVEGDNAELEQADETLFDAWGQRHGYTQDQLAHNRAGRPERTQTWMDKLTRNGTWPAIERHARTFWGSMTW